MRTGPGAAVPGRSPGRRAEIGGAPAERLGAVLREAEVLDRSDFGGAIRYPGCVRLDRLADEAVARADTLARAGIGDLCVDTGGKTAEESAREIRDRIGWA